MTTDRAVPPKEKSAPVQGYTPGIPWSLHLEAYDAYSKRWSPQPAMIDLEGRNCRGGFSTGELDEFIPGWRDRVSEITKLHAEVAALRQALAQPVPDVAAVMQLVLKHAAAYKAAVQGVGGQQAFIQADIALHDAITALVQERDALRTEIDTITELNQAEFRRIAVEQGQDALDAKRYQFLRNIDARDLVHCAFYIGVDSSFHPNKWALQGVDADSAIDAAMGTQPAPTSGKLEPVGPYNSKMIAAPAVVDASHRHHTQCTRYNNNCGAVHPSNCPECPFRKGAQP